MMKAQILRRVMPLLVDIQSWHDPIQHLVPSLLKAAVLLVKDHEMN